MRLPISWLNVCSMVLLSVCPVLYMLIRVLLGWSHTPTEFGMCLVADGHTLVMSGWSPASGRHDTLRLAGCSNILVNAHVSSGCHYA